jgi:hypothetical protein
MNVFNVMDLALRERVINLSNLKKTSLGWTIAPSSYNWVQYPAGLYGRQGYLEPYLIFPFGTKKIQRLTDCEKAAKLFSKSIDVIASDCKNPRITKITFTPTNATEKTILNWLYRDLWTFTSAMYLEFGFESDIQMSYEITLLEKLPFSKFDNYPRIKAHFDPFNVNMTGAQILRRMTIER